MHQLAALPSTPSRERIEQAERDMLALEGQGYGLALDTWHQFADGLVARTIFIPAGTHLTGGAHKAEHLNICHGDITVWTEHGMKRLTGYHVIPSLPGAKRIGRTHADTWWTTVHLNPTNEREVALLEDALVENADRLQHRRLAAIENTAPEMLA